MKTRDMQFLIILPNRKGIMSEENQNHTENTPESSQDQWVPEPAPKFEGAAAQDQDKEKQVIDHEHNQSLAQPSETPQERPTLSSTVSLSTSEERTWAMIAHLSVLLNLVTGFLGGVAAIIIYFVYKDRSRLVAYHAMQSFIFQSITWVGAGLLGGLFIGLGSAFAILIIPLLCLLPGFLFLLAMPASVIYGIIGGVKVNNGEDFRYWQIGDWVREILETKPIS
jgi:uncharacterized Tic20 family protein